MRFRWTLPLLILLALSGCTRSAPPPTGVVTPIGNLTLEEYPVVKASEEGPVRLEFRDRIPPAVRAKRQAWREAERYGEVEPLNHALAPFGYRLVPTGEAFDLYAGERLIRVGLTEIGRITAASEDFAFVARDRVQGAVLVRSGGITPWDVQKYLFIPPVLTETGLVAVEAHYPDGHVLPGTPIPYTVTQDGVKIHRFTVAEQGTRHGVYRLSAWDGRWVAEARGEVIIGGSSLNRQHGYDETFGWQLLAGKPFYFFRTGKSYGLVYDGEVLPQRYAEIPHYRCCEPTMFNPSGNARMVIFYGLRDGLWHYVEIGAYGEQ